MLVVLSLLLATAWLSGAQAVTVYGQAGMFIPSGAIDETSTHASNTRNIALPSAPAYNNLVLTPPPVPSPAPPNTFTQHVPNAAPPGVSIPQSGSFYGFSIEMSVINQIIGKNGSFINPIFLNLMANIKERAGRVYIRVGGNTQETATLVQSLADGAAIEKDKAASSNPTETPALLFTPEILYMLANVTKFVNVQWFLGIPFNDTSNIRLDIAQYGEGILGSSLAGLQVGNEPDLYSSHNHRPQGYGPQNYYDEFGAAVAGIANNSNIPVRNNLVAPSLAGIWSCESIWDTGFITQYANQLGFLAVEHYPDNNCAAAFPNSGFGQPKDPQSIFANYLTHSSPVSIVAPYLNSTAIAQAAGKPFLMFETNSASCGGFPGLSDSFGAALWALDYGLQMAYANFSGALLHVGGQSDTYNPFLPPPTNMTSFSQWTVGAVFYSVIAVAEAFGASNKSQIVDLNMNANNNNSMTPGYAIYEGGSLARVALFNYVTDPSGASAYTATIGLDPGSTPGNVTVKYLLAPSVAEKYNITWAGQTFGTQLKATGIPQGNETLQTVACDQLANTCSVRVPAPGFALVFFPPGAGNVSPATETFSTTALTKTQNTATATVDASVLATSNGQSGRDRAHEGSTSYGSSGAGRGVSVGRGWVGAVVGGAVVGMWVVRGVW